MGNGLRIGIAGESELFTSLRAALTALNSEFHVVAAEENNSTHFSSATCWALPSIQGDWFDAAKTIVKQGKHLFIVSPVGMTVERLKQLTLLAHESGSIVHFANQLLSAQHCSIIRKQSWKVLEIKQHFNAPIPQDTLQTLEHMVLQQFLVLHQLHPQTPRTMHVASSRFEQSALWYQLNIEWIDRSVASLQGTIQLHKNAFSMSTYSEWSEGNQPLFELHKTFKSEDQRDVYTEELLSFFYAVTGLREEIISCHEMLRILKETASVLNKLKSSISLQNHNK